MAGVEWIKVWTNMFEDNRKIKQIELMKNGDGILVIWLKLLLLAGNVNDGGAIYITENKPYTLASLSGELRRPVAIVKQAVDVFEEYGMIEIENGIIYLTSWEKYQSADKLEIIREQTRKRVEKCRRKKKEDVTLGNATGNADVTLGNAAEEEGELEKDASSSPDIAYARERIRMKYLGGKLGGGIVMLSDEQFESLCEKLTIEELEKYCEIIRKCETSGKHFGKSHYKAILDMVKQDRKV